MTNIKKDFNIRNGTIIGSNSSDYFHLTGGDSQNGDTITIAAEGASPNISIAIAPKGTGQLTFPAGSVSVAIGINNTTTSPNVFYPTITQNNIGSITDLSISSTKLSFVPATGTLSVTILNSSSDELLKHNITTIHNPLETLSKLRGVKFDWNDTNITSYGVIAQELEEVLPELIGVDATDFKTVNYTPLIGFLIEAVKSQQTQIDNLLSEISNIKQNINRDQSKCL